jgi:hypothetical protein
VNRVLVALVGVVAGLVTAAPVAAFTAPELFVRQQRWDTHEETGPWLPLASAPAINYLGGYEIGYKLQASGQPNNFQRVALTITGVPDGQPTQPLATPPFCVGRVGTVGTIVAAGPELQFEGDGTYTVKVSVGPGTTATDCLTGPSTTGSFRVPVRVAPSLVGEPFSFRADPLPGNPFVGVRAAAPPGGEADIRCALDGTVQPDGSIAGTLVVPEGDFSHPTVAEDIFPRPGFWTCVARGTVEGVDQTFGTPWSAPLTFDVRSDFRRRAGTVSHRRARRPTFNFKAEWPGMAKGGRATITVFRVKGCKRKHYKLRKLATYHARFGAKRLRVRLRRPRGAGYFLGRFAFAGTRFLRAGVDPNPMLLTGNGKTFGFADPHLFPRCSTAARTAT